MTSAAPGSWRAGRPRASARRRSAPVGGRSADRRSTRTTPAGHRRVNGAAPRNARGACRSPFGSTSTVGNEAGLPSPSESRCFVASGSRLSRRPWRSHDFMRGPPNVGGRATFVPARALTAPCAGVRRTEAASCDPAEAEPSSPASGHSEIERPRNTRRCRSRRPSRRAAVSTA